MPPLNTADDIRIGALAVDAVYLGDELIWNPSLAPAAPVNTVAPAISGDLEAGETLTCSTGTWAGSPPPAFSYQWKRDGGNIPGETAATYVTDEAFDIGTDISCTVTATNTEGSASASSNTVVPTAPPVEYLLRDQFTTADAAPIASPRTCEPGPGELILVDTVTGADAEISGGRYVRPRPSGNQAYANYTAYADDGFPREGGLMAYAVVSSSLIDRVEAIALRYSGEPGNPEAGAIVFTSGGELRVYPSGLEIKAGESLSTGVDYQVAVVARGGGGFLFLIRGGTQYPDWTLLYVSAVGITSPLFVRSGNLNAQSSQDEIAVLRKTGALALDFGKTLAFNPVPETGDTAEGHGDALEYVTWTPQAGDAPEMIFRKVDANNLYKLVPDQAAGTIKLYRRTAGVDTELPAGTGGSTAQVWTPGGQYRVGVSHAGGRIQTYVNEATKHTVTGESQGLTEATSALAGTAAGLANWEIWPRTLSGTDAETLV